MNVAHEQSKGWHRGSRFWRLAPHGLYLAAAMVGAAMYFQPQATEEALGMFSLVCTLIYGGSAVTNYRERNPEFQRAMEERERSQEQRDDDEWEEATS